MKARGTTQLEAMFPLMAVVLVWGAALNAAGESQRPSRTSSA
jgi:hypothetical protein